MASTGDVLNHHLKCFGEGNLESILSDYSSDAVLFVPAGALKGPDAMKPFFRRSFRNSRSLGRRSQCTSSASTVTTRIFSGALRQQTTFMKPRPIRLLYGTERSLRNRSLQRSRQRANPPTLGHATRYNAPTPPCVLNPSSAT